MRRASLKEVVDMRRERSAAPLVRFERDLKSDNNGSQKRCRELNPPHGRCRLFGNIVN